MYKVRFKSAPDVFYKEKIGKKPNTERILDESDPKDAKRIEILKHLMCTNQAHLLTVEIENAENGKFFSRRSTDITFWKFSENQLPIWIISWRHEK